MSEVFGLEVGHSSGWGVVRIHVHLVRHLERYTSCLPRVGLKMTSIYQTKGINLVKFSVGFVLVPGGIASLPQQRGEWGSGFFGKTLELVNPSFTPVSSSPETWHFTL